MPVRQTPHSAKASSLRRGFGRQARGRQGKPFDMVGALEEGAEVQFISESSGYGVTSLVEKCEPYEFVLLRHMVDTKENGEQEREKEWIGGQESYSLAERDGTTTLMVELDAPPEQVETFEERLPKALRRVKELAEKLK